MRSMRFRFHWKPLNTLTLHAEVFILALWGSNLVDPLVALYNLYFNCIFMVPSAGWTGDSPRPILLVRILTPLIY